jgi:alkylated DNA nucleotide flippase Atl1
VRFLPKSKLTWTEKLRETKEGYPKVEPIPERLGSRLGKGTLVIPAPLEVDKYMRQVPKGKLTTINEIRVALARRHGATISCPITTGIFSWIAAHAAEEQQQQGIVDITPYWRTLKTGGLLNEKYPGGVEGQRRLLENEGHVVVSKGKNYVVLNYQSALASL